MLQKGQRSEGCHQGVVINGLVAVVYDEGIQEIVTLRQMPECLW